MINQSTQRVSEISSFFRQCKSHFKKISLLSLFIFLGTLHAYAQCVPTNKYDKIISSFHQSVAIKSDGTYSTWGDLMASNGTSAVLSPQDINVTNYPTLTGTVLKASLGSNRTSAQGIVLSTTGLFAWGTSGTVIDATLTNNGDSFRRIATPTGGDANTGLPVGVTPANVKMLFTTYQTLAIVTSGGDVWVLTQAAMQLAGNGLTGTPSAAQKKTWYKVQTSAGVSLANVDAIRGQVADGTHNALMALTTSGTIYTWGASTFLGDGSAVSSNRTYATSMSLPTGVTGADVKMIGVNGGNNTTTSTNNTYYLLSNQGYLYALGENNNKQVGDYTTTTRTSWVNVKTSPSTNMSGITTFSVQEHDAAYSAAVAVTTAGDLYTWGENQRNMLGQTNAAQNYDPSIPATFNQGADRALFAEVGGHTLVYLKQGTTQFCYVGHKTNGSMGDGTTANVDVVAFDCSNTPSLYICGSVPVVASPITSLISANQTTINADGTATSTITIQLKDALGNNLTTTGGTVTVATSAGTLGTVVDNNNGTYSVILTSSNVVTTANITYVLNGTTGTNTAAVAFVSGGTSAPTGASNQSFCVANNPTLADLAVTGTAIQWYAAASGGSPLAANTTLVDGTVYYASQTVNSVESVNRLAVTATVSAAVTVSVSPSAPTLNVGQSVTLVASGATTYAWSPNTDISAITGASVISTPSSTITYTVTGTSGACSSSMNVVVTISGGDTDGDGVSDAQELLDGTNPNDGCSYNASSQVLANTSNAWRTADCDGDGTANFTDSQPLNFCVGGSGVVPANGTPAYDIFRYQDCDGDGILNGMECTTGVNCPDFDGDGIPNYLDTDSDNDQIGDITEGEVDTDGDGKSNYLDLDSDNDGILDSRETTNDLDGDGKPNYLDLDSDEDGILDTFEGTADYRPFGDSNGDGVCDVNGVTSDSNYNGIPDNVEQAFGGKPLEIPDTDKDGLPDFLDLDSDGDGILDSIELRGDMDADQHPNYRDRDSDGDGVSDAFEKFGDMDADGKPNFLDLDSDGDGLSDQYEGLNLCFDCGRVDNNDDGYDDRAQQNSKYPAVDTDGDGAPDFLDLDSDNDGIPDAVEAGNDPKNPVDTDKDGTPDFRDIDSDNDGIPDSIEAGKDPAVPVDTDKDGTPDFRDLDSDNDGITDAIEAGADPKKPLDTDGDGIYDFRDLDSDNDGISDNIEKGPSATPVDTDKDGLPDYRDIDSDNDGISDNIEKGPTATPVDTDGDGTPDFRDLDSDNDGISDNIEKGPSATPVDTDGDGTADFRDLDSDNDGILDNTEKGPSATPIDTDGDGTADFRDLDSDNDGISDNIEKGPTANPVDTDGDGLPDYRDLDSDSDTISDNIEKGPTATPVDTDKDGNADFRDLDSDNDGITDKVEAGPDPKNPLDTDKDGIYDFRDLDSDNDGILDKDEDNINIAGLADCDKDGIPNRLDPDKCPTFIPQGISPNGDGKNDTFIIPGILNAQPNTLTIFNRWGNIVYEKDNYQNDWRGQTDRAFDLLASDGLLPDGTYYYVIDFKGNKSNVKSFIYVNRLDK
jgi:gliding motility-associated-like protein